MARSGAEHGAGFAGARADEVAKLAAAILCNDAAQVGAAINGIDRQVREGNCPQSGNDIRGRIEPLLKRMFPKVVSARALPKGGAGDVEVVTGNGQGNRYRIEIKAQLDREKAAHLTQADWVRGSTDTLRHLCLVDRTFVADPVSETG